MVQCWIILDANKSMTVSIASLLPAKSLEQHAAAASAHGGLLNRSPRSPPVHKPQGTLRMVAHRVGCSTMSSMSSDSEGESADREESAAVTAAASMASTEGEANSKGPTPEEKVGL
eukprot:1156361-Pelagomonas_calceolata.AAC.6